MQTQANPQISAAQQMLNTIASVGKNVELDALQVTPTHALYEDHVEHEEHHTIDKEY